jgi:hypothetical protein
MTGKRGGRKSKDREPNDIAPRMSYDFNETLSKKCRQRQIPHQYRKYGILTFRIGSKAQISGLLALWSVKSDGEGENRHRDITLPLHLQSGGITHIQRIAYCLFHPYLLPVHLNCT